MSAVVRTCEVVDELVTEEGAIVLVTAPDGHRVIRLSVLGQLIRELAVDGIPMDLLVRELESRLGPSADGDAQRLSAAAVAAMEADSLVSLTPDHLATARNERGENL